MGFNAIWISPIPDNYPNQFHGYAAKNMTEVNKHFGGEAGLKSLVDACHAQGNILVYSPPPHFSLYDLLGYMDLLLQ